MKPKIFSHTLRALSLITLTCATSTATDITWNAGPSGTGTDWNTATNWVNGAVPTNSTNADIAIFAAPTVGQPNLSVSRGISGVNFTDPGTLSWTLSATAGETLTLGSVGIDATGFRSGTINITTPTSMASASAATWSIFDSTLSLPAPAPVFNISGAIALHSGAQLQILSQRASTSTGSGTINITAPITGTSTGTVKFAGTTSSRNIINLIGAASTYEAITSSNAVNLNFDRLAPTGSPSPFGAKGIINVGEGNSATLLNYVGTTPATTDRQFTIGLASGAATFQINNNSTVIGDAAALNLTSTASILAPTADGTSTRSLQLSGTQNGSNTFAGLIQNNGTGITSFTKNGAGTWILTNTANSFTGGVTLLGGRLHFPSEPTLGSTSGPINFTGNANLVATADATLSASRTITVTAAKVASFGITSENGTTLIIDSKITGTDGIVARTSGSSFDTGVVRFTNNTNNYTGNFQTRFGQTEFTSITNPGQPSALGAGTAIEANNSNSATIFRHIGTTDSSTTRPIIWDANTGDLILENTGTGTLSYLSTTPIVIAADGTKTLVLGGTNTGANTFAQPLANSTTSGISSLQKIGDGKWTITAANTYTDLTVITGGTLALGNAASISSSSGLIFRNGATLDVSAKTAPYSTPASQSVSGTGAIVGQPLTVSGPISPGNTTAAVPATDTTPAIPASTTGTLSTPALTLAAGSAVTLELDSSAATSGTLAIAGDLSISPTTTLSLVDRATTPVATGTTLTLATYTGTRSGTFANLPEGTQIPVGPNTFTISYATPGAITLRNASLTSPFQTWIDSFPSLTPEQKSPNDDPDNDGATNLQEFAFDGNPASGTNTGKTQSSIATVGTTRHLTITIPVRNGATFTGTSPLTSNTVDGVSYLIRGSTNLDNFGETIVEVTPALATVPTLSTGWSYRTFRLSAETSAQPRAFIQAGITAP